tara:strand:+ start:148 stop:420 length:273 start_codon:yes stop_codon:yes gene_type:complete
MREVCYIDLKDARKALKAIGIDLTDRQIKRAAEVDAKGKRKLPFFVDPIDKKLKIDKHLLLSIYSECQYQAEKNAHVNLASLKELFDLSR